MLNKLTSFALISLTAATSFWGCTKSKPLASNHSIRLSNLVADQTVAPTDKAETLAKAAEQLLSVQGFAYANDVADLALAQDSTNFRAQFVKAVLAPVMAEKGILARIAPLVARDTSSQNEYDKMLASLETQSPNSTIKSFLLDGQPNIANEDDVQDYYDAVAAGFESLRQFAKAHKDQPLTVMASDTFYQTMLKRWGDSCVVKQEDPWDYDYECPSQLNLMQVTFNRADFESLQEFAAGSELYLSLYNSYNLTGGLQVLINHRDDSGVTPQTITNELLSNPKFATLRAGNAFQKIKDMGADALSGIHWVMDNQNSLCPMGETDPHNRIGALMNQGLCVEKSSAPNVALALHKIGDLLNGGSYTHVILDDNANVYSVVMKPAAILDRPIADLRTLTPLTYDRCNNIVGVGDNSVGGLFPNYDASHILQIDHFCYP